MKTTPSLCLDKALLFKEKESKTKGIGRKREQYHQFRYREHLSYAASS